MELTTKLNLEVNPINNPVPLNVPVEIIENNQVIENNVLKSPIHLPQMELSNDDLSATLTGDDFTRKLHCNETLRQTQPESEEAILEPWEDDSLDWDPQFYVNTKDKKPEFVPLPSAYEPTDRKKIIDVAKIYYNGSHFSAFPEGGSKDKFPDTIVTGKQIGRAHV